MLRVYKVQWHYDERVGSIESYVEGEWIQYNDNLGNIYETAGENSQKANAFSHFVLEETQQQATILDLQGTVLICNLLYRTAGNTGVYIEPLIRHSVQL